MHGYWYSESYAGMSDDAYRAFPLAQESALNALLSVDSMARTDLTKF